MAASTPRTAGLAFVPGTGYIDPASGAVVEPAAVPPGLSPDERAAEIAAPLARAERLSSPHPPRSLEQPEAAMWRTLVAAHGPLAAGEIARVIEASLHGSRCFGLVF